MSANTRDGDYGTAEIAGRDEKLQPNYSSNNIIFIGQPRKLNTIALAKKIILSLIVISKLSPYFITVTNIFEISSYSRIRMHNSIGEVPM